LWGTKLRMWKRVWIVRVAGLAREWLAAAGDGVGRRKRLPHFGLGLRVAAL